VPLERVSQGFKDISMTFQKHPLTNDILALKNESAIARSVRNIVFTTPGEKIFNQDFGSSISKALFENINDISANIIKGEITSSLTNYEPRIKLKKVQVDPNFDQNEFNVTIFYEIIGADVPAQELQFVLQPTR
jgi:phage baseplate assembly protein W